MKNAIRSVVLGSLSLSLLSGCVDDNYDYSANTPNPPAPSNEVVVYGPQSTGDFHPQVTDSNGLTADVDADGYVRQGNITTRQLVPNQNQGFLNVKTSGDRSPASIQAITTNGQGIDVTRAKENGTLQFEVRVHEKPAKDAAVFVTLSSEDPVISPSNSEAPKASVNITGAFNSFVGADTQFIKVPLSCFAGEDGEGPVDFSKTEVPFSIETTSDVNFDFGNVKLISNTDNQWYVVPCEQTSIIATGPESDIFDRSEIPVQGWGRRVTTWGPKWKALHWEGDFVKAEVEEAAPGQNGGVVFRTHTDDLTSRDISRFIETGVLEFMLRVDSYANHPTQTLTVKMETITGYGSSETVMLEPGLADNRWQRVQVPLKQLFTKGDGKIDMNIVQHIDRPLSIMPEPVQAPDTVEGMAFRIANVKLKMNP